MDGVFNYMEIVVEDKLNKLIDENNVCENCKKAIFALSLNFLHLYYISTDTERITAKFNCYHDYLVLQKLNYLQTYLVHL